MRAHRTVLGCFLVTFVLQLSLHAKNGGESIPSNLSLFQRQVKTIVGEILASGNIQTPDSFALKTESNLEGLLIQQAATSGLQEAGHKIFLTTDVNTDWSLGFSASKLSVRYEKGIEDGFFGTKRVRRIVSTKLSSLLIGRNNGEVFLAKDFEREAIDTVDASRLTMLEDESIPFTQGIKPDEGFINRLVEPFIILGAAGTAIYLLFHIRS